MLILPKELGPKKNYQICAAEVREELGGEEAGKLEICIFARAVSGQSDVIVRLGVVDGKDIR